MTDNTFMPAKLAEIIEDFGYCEGNEKLEYLLQFAESLPPLPEWLLERRDDMEEVHECITPVFVYGETKDGKMNFYFDAPPESPTVRGFASILMEGVSGTGSPEEILNIPDTFYLGTGLQQVLSGQRLNGMSTFLMYMKRIAAQQLEA